MTNLDLPSAAGALVQPVNKLIDVVAASIGVVYEPTRIRRRARAEADALITYAHADATRREIEQRTIERLSTQELRRQANIDAIVEQSIVALPPQVSPDPVDPDWVARFFTGCQDISHDGLRTLWAKVLAREVTQPKSCSRKTIGVLQELDPEAAAVFARLCRLAWRSEQSSFAILPEGDIASLAQHGITYGELLDLEHVGLIHLKADTFLTLNETATMTYFDRRHHVGHRESQELRIPVLVFTVAGSELAPVVDVTADDRYYAASLAQLRSRARDLLDADGRVSNREDR